MAVHRRIVVTGRVQGVGFRWTAATVAERLGVTGTARNLDDGSVEVIAAGDDQSVEEFTEWLRVGPAGARVDDVATTDLHDDARSEPDFRIL